MPIGRLGVFSGGLAAGLPGFFPPPGSGEAWVVTFPPMTFLPIPMGFFSSMEDGLDPITFLVVLVFSFDPALLFDVDLELDLVLVLLPELLELDFELPTLLMVIVLLLVELPGAAPARAIPAEVFSAESRADIVTYRTQPSYVNYFQELKCVRLNMIRGC